MLNIKIFLITYLTILIIYAEYKNILDHLLIIDFFYFAFVILLIYIKDIHGLYVIFTKFHKHRRKLHLIKKNASKQVGI